MTGRYCVRFVLIALAALIVTAGRLVAGDLYNKAPVGMEAVVLPKPAEIQALTAYPGKIALKGSDDAQQLIVTAKLNSGRLQDLSTDAQYEVADDKIVRVTTSGRILPLTNGHTEIVARYGDKLARVPVSVQAVDVNLPINFANQIVPIFTKLGCNGGGCHGKASGQNGFKISLLGFEPEVDFTALVKEARGRRVFPAAPDYSLLLRKATGQLPHGGGKRMEAGSDEYKLIRRWIAAGMPMASPTTQPWSRSASIRSTAF
jgi:methionine-rich copper-binding protein CopC